MFNRHPSLEAARRELVRRRDEILRLTATHQAGEEVLLSEREPDWEDTAAEVRDAAVLERLVTGERRELTEIDAALGRLRAGTWGTCKSCGGSIAAARLRARPEAEVCLACAERAERGPRVPSDRPV